jgi:hypothetical protein
MEILKKHWFLWLAVGLFIYAVWSVSGTLAKVAAALLALIAAVTSFALWPLLLAIWALGFVFGFLPNSFYDWIPRSQAANSTATLVQPQIVP